MKGIRTGWGRRFTAAAFAFVWLASGQALLASPAGDAGHAEEALGACTGCHGLTGYADSAFAPPPCSQTPYGAWMIGVTVDIFDGECEGVTRKGKRGCLGSPCESSVTYSWGSEVADANLEVGYEQVLPLPAPESVWGWGGKPPWVKGETGSVTLGPESNPKLSCETEMNFFIRGEACGGSFEASCFGRCTPCMSPEM